MNKTEFIAAIAEKAELKKSDAQKAFAAFTEVIAEELRKGEKVTLIGFGTFSTSERAERQGINPRTKETITIKARKSIRFKAGASLVEEVSTPVKKGKGKK